MYVFYFSRGPYFASAIAPDEACARVVAMQHQKLLDPSSIDFISDRCGISLLAGPLEVRSEPCNHRVISREEWLATMVADSAKKVLRSLRLIC